MPKTKISEFSATPANNTDIDSINIAEGCAPSGINDAIRELMSQLKDFQTGAVGDSFNGPVGSTTASTGAFTTLTTTGTINLLTVGRGAGAVATNTAVGASALQANTTGSANTAVGYQAGYTNTTGAVTAFGHQALYSNSTGTYNIGFGNAALYTNTTGSNNAGFGSNALYLNTTGTYNTAIGMFALNSNTTASYNTAVGYQAGYSNTTGTAQVAVGNAALDACTTGSRNTAIGDNALGAMTTADNNTAVGRSAGLGLTTGVNNTFVGAYNGANGGSGAEITTGSKNTILGTYNGNQGGLDIRTSSNRIVLSDGDGNPRLISDASGNWLLNTVSQNGVGRFSIKYNGSSEQAINIRDTADASGSAFMVFGSSAGTTYGTITNNSNTGVLYNVTSDQRLKQNIVDAPEFGSVIDSIQVRSYDWKSNGSHQRAGFIAQELVTVAPEAVHQPTDTEEMMAVDYSKLVPMLVKEVQSLRQRLAAANL